MFEAGPVPTPESSSARVVEFRALFLKFQAGVRWLAESMDAWTGARQYHPRIDRDIAIFREKVEGPMDAMWAGMTNDERKAFDDGHDR